MEPNNTATAYNQIAQWWQIKHQDSQYGIAQLERAIAFTSKRQTAIDIGCGSSGRFINILSQHGFLAEGLDISKEMIELAKNYIQILHFIRQIFVLGFQRNFIA